jgi:hypothetical protein
MNTPTLAFFVDKCTPFFCAFLTVELLALQVPVAPNSG